MSCVKPNFARFPDECPYQPYVLKDCSRSSCEHFRYKKEDIIREAAKVSILMPYYNKQATIKKAVESVITQTLSNWELIIVNDGSDEKFPDSLLEEYVDYDIKYLDLKSNYGQAVARNEAFKASSNKFIAYLDADDEWTKDHLVESLKVLLESKHIVYGNFFYKTFLQNSAEIIPYYYEEDIINNIGKVLKTTNPISINSVMHLRSAFITAGGFEPGVVCGEDGLLWRRMFEAGATFGFKEKSTSFYCRYDEVNPKYHQSIALNMPKAIKGRHLVGNGTNGQELDIQENYKERVRQLKEKVKGIQYITED